MAIDNAPDNVQADNGTVAPAVAPVNPKENKLRTAALIAVTAVMSHIAAGYFGRNWLAVAFIIAIFLGVAYFFTKYVGDDNEDNVPSA